MLRFLKAKSFSRSYKAIGEINFPYSKCVPCMSGMYDLDDPRVEIESEIRFAEIRSRTVVFAACDDYLCISKCPYFLKMQDAMLNGRIVKIVSISRSPEP